MIENINLNKNDYDILECLIKYDRNTPYKSATLQFIINDTKFSHVKVRQALKYLKLCGFVKEGFKDSASKTYYATKEAFKNYMEVMDYNEKDIEDLINKNLGGK